MDFLYIQIIIFITIILSAVLAGKKGALIACLIWAIETYIIYKMNSFNYLQIITLGLSCQLAIIIAIFRDLIVKHLKKKTQER